MKREMLVEFEKREKIREKMLVIVSIAKILKITDKYVKGKIEDDDLCDKFDEACRDADMEVAIWCGDNIDKDEDGGFWDTSIFEEDVFEKDEIAKNNKKSKKNIKR